MHDVRHVAMLVPLFRFIQGRRRTWHRSAHTLINSQETWLVTGLAAARQLGAGYPFDDPEARRMFNYYGRIMHGWRFTSIHDSNEAPESPGLWINTTAVAPDIAARRVLLKLRGLGYLR